MPTHPTPQDQAEQRACYIALALVSIRRLFALRHNPRDGAEARSTLRKWAASLRELRAADAADIKRAQVAEFMANGWSAKYAALGRVIDYLSPPR